MSVSVLVALHLAATAPSTVFISEVVYDPAGTEPDGEWVELVNVGDVEASLDEVRIADAESTPDNEGVLKFPAGATIPAFGTVLIANKSSALLAASGHRADFELKATDAAVAKLTADTDLGGTLSFSLANGSDEVLLLDADGFILDGVSWGRTTPIQGISNLAATEGQSLQRDFSAVSGPAAWRAAAPRAGVVVIADRDGDATPVGSEGEGEGDVVAEGEGDVVAEGEGDVVAEGEGDVVAEGEGDVVAEGEGDVVAEGEGDDGEPAPRGEPPPGLPVVDDGGGGAFEPDDEDAAVGGTPAASGGCAATGASTTTLAALLLLLLRRRR